MDKDNIEIMTLNQAFNRAGGFGRFQYLVCIVTALLRNFGMTYIYLAALATIPQDYLC